MKALKIAAIGTIALLTACHKQIAVAPPPAPAPPVAAAKAAPPSQPQPVSTAAPQPRQVASAMPNAETKATIQALLNRIQDIYFDYNQHALRPDAQATLESDAKTLREILQQYPTYKLTVEGFCDERGSEEYNIALGDQRARKAEEFLENLGLSGAQLRTVSYGKEKPVCTEHDESCWQKNRRAHITQQQPS